MVNGLQGHIYNSFLHAIASDVTLHIHVINSWAATYHLHRVVLTQATFFRSLFTAGFLESSHKSPQSVTVRLPDSNISRAAFELCLSRLYGGGPAVYVPSSIIPTRTHPLTPAFFQHKYIVDNDEFMCPEDSQLATPSFLMSLLAAGSYLSIPSITSLAVSTILNTIGPETIIPYLKFALGEGVDQSSASHVTPAAGLEQLAKSFSPCSVVDYDLVEGLDDAEDDITTDDTKSSVLIDDADEQSTEHRFYYGMLSDRIGHACACWLSRWGVDILGREEASEIEQGEANDKTLRIWRRGGLNPLWISALLSSDIFFVRGEWERYQVAKRAIEIRRREGLDEQEELIWREFFESGILYCNLTFEQLTHLSTDYSPTTQEPFVTSSVLHAANWIATSLRHSITLKPSAYSGSSSSSPVQRDKELGLSVTAGELASSMASTLRASGSRHYYLVPSDSVESRLSDPSDFIQTAQQLGYEYANLPPKQMLPSEHDFFGLVDRSRRLTPATNSIDQSDGSSSSRWSPFPPLRFGVEFWDLEALKERSRLHSHTVWYGGSLFNVYVQVAKKKGGQGLQLGIYLHRQSTVDPMPPMSKGSDLQEEAMIGTSSSGMMNHTRSLSAPIASVAVPLLRSLSLQSGPSPPPSQARAVGTDVTPSRGQSPGIASPASPIIRPSASLPTVVQIPAPPQPYRDPRSSLSAYFTISCANPTGAGLTKFSSAPDVFAVGQSWGWKSSSLKSEDYVQDSGDDNSRIPRPMSSLRATVVLGLV